MKIPHIPAILLSCAAATLIGCSKAPSVEETGEDDAGESSYGLTSTTEIIVTSEAGDILASKANIAFGESTHTTSPVITIHPEVKKQTIVGIGSSFTESSAFVLAHLEKGARAEVMDKIYGEDGANFSLARTPIGSTDFSVEGKLSYAEVPDDAELEHFTILPDQDGFNPERYPGIQDTSFDVLPMIKEALAIKQAQEEKDLRIVSSAWTAPPWMKDIETWYIKPTPENNHQGTGGDLKPQYIPTYAEYIVKYLDAYKQEGIDIWAITPVNEPHGNSGQWESMHFSPETQGSFIKDHLGPKLAERGHGDTKILIYDQNRDGLEHWTDTIYGDEEVAKYVYGAAVHWYSSTYKVHEDTFDRVHEKFPNFAIIHTEGTIDDLGKPAPGGIADTEKFTEHGWFNNDAFWWNSNATDWAYTASWAPNVEDHPVYTPVHRYARNIIKSLDHWMEGWIDWNIVLDHNGGPNHVGNFCGAPIMIDTNTGQIYYTPIYHVLSQFSRTIRPGDVAVQTTTELAGIGQDNLHASATVSETNLLSVQVLNTTKEPIQYSLQIGSQTAQVTIDANALQTVRVQL